MNTSLDRKMARCAAEIEAAKPKGMSYADFENIGHEIAEAIKGAATCKASGDKHVAPGAASPSPQAEQPAPKFKVGDRVTARTWGNGVVIDAQDFGAANVIYRCEMDEGTTWFHAGTLQLAPSQEAAKGDAEPYEFKVGDRVTTTESGPDDTSIYVLVKLIPKGESFQGEWRARCEDDAPRREEYLGIYNPSFLTLVAP